jgi:hypothetical protein
MKLFRCRTIMNCAAVCPKHLNPGIFFLFHLISFILFVVLLLPLVADSLLLCFFFFFFFRSQDRSHQESRP